MAMVGKVVVITGASSGVGKAMALAFARQHALLILSARREDALEEVARECNELGATAHVFAADTRDAAAMRALAHMAKSIRGRIDVWINNAGVLAIGALESIPSDVNEAVIRTNLIGYMNGAQAVVPVFKLQGYGTLINNISVGAWFPTPYMAAYSASKFGLKGFANALKGELNEYPNIQVCNLYPGFLDTGGMQHAANYTGKYVKPVPPLYDPVQLAESVVALARHPRSVTTGGVFPWFLYLGHLLFPRLSRNITAAVLRRYLKASDNLELTSGNVLEPTEYGTGIYGGWRSCAPKPERNMQLLLAAGAVAGVLLVVRKLVRS